MIHSTNLAPFLIVCLVLERGAATNVGFEKAIVFTALQRSRQRQKNKQLRLNLMADELTPIEHEIYARCRRIMPQNVYDSVAKFELKEDDILMSGGAKTGTTWMQQVRQHEAAPLALWTALGTTRTMVFVDSPPTAFGRKHGL